MNIANTIDCRGLSCPEPVLRTARAARALSNAVGGTLEILADDDAFPMDIESWCRSANASLTKLEPVIGGGHRALIAVKSKVPVPKPAPVAEAVAAPAQPAWKPAPLDCRGKLCPEPVLALARFARSNSGRIEVLADDPAFRVDVAAWCRSAGATLVSLQEEGQALRATVDVGVRKSASQASERIVASAPAAPASLDCRGKQCPEPVLALARHARQHPSSEVEIVADDPAFAADVEAWCRSAGATITARSEEGNALRVRILIGAKLTRSNASSSGRESAPIVRLSQPMQLAAPSGEYEARFDLRRRQGSDVVSEVARIALLGEGTTVELIVGTPELAQQAMRALVTAGHEILEFERERGRLAVRLGATDVAAAAGRAGLAVRGDGPDCTLLVLHNDLEALLAAMLVANGAAAAGQKVLIFFTFWGLNALRGESPNPAAPAGSTSFFQRVFKWLMPKGPSRQGLGQLNFGGIGSMIMGSIMREQNISDLPKLMRSAEEMGVRFVACTMSMGVMGITKRDLHPYSNLEFAGVATFVEASRVSAMSLVF